MFSTSVYIERRKALKELMGNNGIGLFVGNNECPMNFKANPYPFRQDSSFLYFFGINNPSLIAIIDFEKDESILFGDDLELDDIIWMGFTESIESLCIKAGIPKFKPSNALKSYITQAVQDGKKIHFLPSYRTDSILELQKLFDLTEEEIKNTVSKDLVKSIINLRSIKDHPEITEFEKCQDITFQMYIEVFKRIKTSNFSYELLALMLKIATENKCKFSFPPIITTHGEILHTHDYNSSLDNGKLLLIDSGLEGELGYATDITRTVPVNGKFTLKQKEIYEIVLSAHDKAAQLMKPGVSYQSIHLESAKVLANGLKNLGLMKGNIDDAVSLGAHALFFPHGLGHLVGLDVHDLESLGEDNVGYDNEIIRSKLFGTAYLRYGKKLKSGMVITNEPGIYFIPTLIDSWSKDNKFLEYINYEKLADYIDFGGVRLEDNYLITDDGCKIIGKRIPIKIDEIERVMQ